MVSYIVPDNYPDIISAINAIPAGEFGDVLVREGHWVLNPVGSPLNQIVARSNMLLRGEGIDKTIIDMTPEGAAPIRADVVTSIGDVSNFTMEDLTVNGHGTPDNMGSQLIFLRTGNHSNIAIRRVKAINAFGAGIGLPRVAGGIIEDNVVDNAWTGITVESGTSVQVLHNQVLSVSGDAIYLQGTCKDCNIADNYTLNVPDTAIDVTAMLPEGPHERIRVYRNKFTNGSMRFTNCIDCEVYNNTIDHGSIDVDAGQATPKRISVHDNTISSDGQYGIGFFGAQDSQAQRNTIRMLPPVGAVVQSGIIAAIWTSGLIEENTITGGDYSIDFGGWALGSGQNITIRRNKLFDFRIAGIYDDNMHTEPVYVIENQIYSMQPSATYGILVEAGNVWTITGNALKVNQRVGDQAISSLYSILTGNYEYVPPAPTFYLTVMSTPILGVPVIINGQNYTTPTILSLAQEAYTVTVASEFQLGADKYYFARWEDGSTNPARTINLTADTTITATYTLAPPPTHYTLIITAATGGTTNPTSGRYDVEEDTSAVVTAIPDASYSFVRWELDGTIRTENPITVIMDRDYSLRVIFEALPPPPPQQVYLTIASVNGTTNPVAGTYTINVGSSVTVTCTPNSGYQLKEWLLDNVSVGTSPSYTVLMDINHSLIAVSEQIPPPVTHTLFISATAGGTTYPTPGTYEFTEGTVTGVVPIPNNGYRFANWTLDGETRTDNPINITMNADHSLEAVFELLPTPPPEKQYLTIVAINGQTNPAQGTYEMDKNSPVTITATPNTGYQFKQWLVDNAQAGTTPFITVTMDTNHTVIAEFTQVTPPIVQAGFPIWVIPVALLGVGVLYLARRKK